jgi:flagellar hook-length control protein FliK
VTTRTGNPPESTPAALTDQLAGAGQLTTGSAPTGVTTLPAQSAAPAAMIPVPVTTQVAQQMNQYLLGVRSLRDGTHRAVIKLNPEHLGQVTLTLDVHGGNVRMDVLAGPQAIDALRNDLSDLRNQLAQSGLQLDDVSLRQSGTSGGDPGSSNNPNPGRANDSAPNSGNTGHRQVESIQPGGYRSRGSTVAGQLDVLI